MSWSDVLDRFDDLAEVLWRRAAAAADDGDPEVGHVVAVERGELLRREVVVRLAVDDAGQAGIGQHADRERRVLRQVAQVLLHLGRAGGAVDAHDVRAHRRDRHQRGTDLAAEQHPAGGLHRDLDLERHRATGGLHGPAAGDDRGLRLEQVEARLDEEEVGAALEEAGGLLLVGVPERREVDVSEARHLRAGADRSGDVAGAAVGGEVVGDLSCETGRSDVELVGLVGDVVFGEHQREAAEARGLDGVDADLEECRVHPPDRVRSREAQHLVAPLERGTAEVVGGEVEVLDVGAERAIEDDHSLVDGVEEVLRIP